MGERKTYMDWEIQEPEKIGIDLNGCVCNGEADGEVITYVKSCFAGDMYM